MNKFAKLFFIFSGATILSGAFFGVVLYLYFTATLPKIYSPADYQPNLVTQIYIEDNGKQEVIAEFFKERRYLVAVETLPDFFKNAFLAAEDDRFYEHEGLNYLAILRAFFANLRAGTTVQGGSTITQQVVKSLYLNPEKKIVRKIKEAILAVQLEKNLTKDQILYLYLNQIYFGQGSYGVFAAAKTYFRKTPSELTIAEMALLAGMPQAPSRYNPLVHPKLVKDRQSYVLKRMKELRIISDIEYQNAVNENIKIYYLPESVHQSTAYLVEHVRRELLQKYGENALYEQGLQVFVPSQLKFYDKAHEALQEGLRAIDKRMGFRGPVKKVTIKEEVDELLKKITEEALKNGPHYQILSSIGELQPDPEFTGASLYKEGEMYQGIVESVSEDKKLVSVNLGTFTGEINKDGYQWALDRRQKKSKRITDWLEVGDVIWVKVKANKKNKLDLILDQQPQVQGALYSLEAKTGKVIAMIGGYDFEKSEFNRATQAQRQMGSAFKPIIYAAGIENGYTPASIIVDSPIVFDDEEQGKWKPSNFEDTFYGDTVFRHALIKSRNIPTIKIVQNMGIQTVVQYAKQLGFKTDFNPDLSISLGSAVVSLGDLTTIYALFPRQGAAVAPIYINSVKTRFNEILEENQPESILSYNPLSIVPPEAISPTEGENNQPPMAAQGGADKPVFYPLPNEQFPNQRMDPRTAYVLTNLMKEVVEFGTGARAKVLGLNIAGKTGTTNEYKDAWFMGFTPNLVTGVWVGFDDQQTLGRGETGSGAAIPIWLSYMKEVATTYPEEDFRVPPGIVFANIDQKTGRLAHLGAQNSVREAFIEGTEPKQSKQFYKTNSSPEGAEPGESQVGVPETQNEFLKEELE